MPKEQRNPVLKARLKDPGASGTAMLAWAVEGCLRWQDSGLRVPKVVEKATEQYRADMDPLREFIEDRCVLHLEAWVAAGQLRAAYEDWSKQNGERYLIDPRAFAERLRSRGCNPSSRRVLSSIKRGWQGIGLRADDRTETET